MNALLKLTDRADRDFEIDVKLGVLKGERLEREAAILKMMRLTFENEARRHEAFKAELKAL